MTASLVLPPLSLYVHIPWCVRKCPYCDFNSHQPAQTNALPEADYIKNLEKDLQQDLHWSQGRKLCSIFFGGGTPSLFSGNGIGQILSLAEKHIGFEPNIEITLEANPGAVEQDKFADFYAAGLNRLSIGIQSFQPQKLTQLGRIHSTDEAQHAVIAAQEAGFTNINLDLMHGLPKQTTEDALHDLNTAINLQPQHISWYQLTIEPNTVFYRQPPPLPADDILADIQDSGLALLHDHGYRQYEVSAFAQSRRESQHNLNYWQFGDYIGIGAGAHGKNTDASTGTIFRRNKTRLPEHYLERPAFKEVRVDSDELPLEFLMNSLRLVDGVPIGDFAARTGVPLAHIEPQLTPLIQQGLLQPLDTRLQTTELGQRFLNTVLSTLMATE